MPWDPETYNKFQHEREQPFEDLFRLLTVRSGLQVIDLGCGTGRITRQLADRLPDSDVLGVDSSPQMLASASELERPGLRFELKGIEAVQGTWDVVFSHAAIQWLDDHVHLVPRLFSLVRPGGQLAVQMPDNHHSTPHRLIAETAQAQPFAEALAGWVRVSPNLSIEQYAELLYAHCHDDFAIFARIYPVQLPDVEALLNWQRGTALLPYLERLPRSLQAAFVERYRERLRRAYRTGPIFYPFRRILFAGMRRV